MTINCELCGEAIHSVKRHLGENHPEMTVEEYQEKFPNAPLLSEAAKERIREIKEKRAAEAGKSDMVRSLVAHEPLKTERKPLHEVFQIPKTTPGVLSKVGSRPIPVAVYDQAPKGFEDFIPEIDSRYIFNVDSLKTVLMGFEMRINAYLSGHAGVGKSTLFEQACAFTRRAMMRIQHTVNTEEAHILGQYVVKDGSTVWEPGPLQLCMRYGLVYLADEYDRALPQVLSVYQPVLEGKPLVTKEAPPEWRVIKPHPDFRICATGNTNGSGDETGLYPSTALQDFANYERFGIMFKVDWMPEAQETAVVTSQSGVKKEVAQKLVEFATKVRTQVDAGQISSPISPRALINAAKLGFTMGSFSRGLQMAYINRLYSVDATACSEIAQRIFADG